MIVRRSLALTALVALAGCGGGGGSSAVPIAVAPAPGSGSGAQAAARGFTYDAGFVAKSRLVGAAHLGGFGVELALPMRDAPGLAAYAAAASTPGSASYRRFLSPGEIADRFAATPAQQQAAVAYLQSYGLSVATWQQRLVVRAAGTQAQLEAALHTTFGEYVSPAGETFVAPETAPRVAASSAIVGSPDIVLRTKRFAAQFVTARGLVAGYAPQQLAAAFDYDGAYASGYTGAGITVGIIGTGPISLSTGSRVGDLEAYKRLYGVTGASAIALVPAPASQRPVNANGPFATPPTVTGPCTTASQPGASPSYSPTATCDPEDGETQLDTEVSATLARDAGIEYYLAYAANEGCGTADVATPCPAGTGYTAQGIYLEDEEIETAIARDTADVLSLSFGGAEVTQVVQPGQTSPPQEFTADGSGLGPTEFAMLAAEGVAVFVSSGDDGAQGCAGQVSGSEDSLCVSYPASDPNVTAVGGVTTPLNAAGQFVGPVTAWGPQTSEGDGGTGGGVSAYFAQPAYQQGLAGVIGTTRNVPDVSLDGDPRTGISVLTNADPSLGGAQIANTGGTSAAAPQMAAMWALVLQACKSNAACAAKGAGAHPYRLGNPNAALYALYKARTPYAQTFLTVGIGTNAQAPYCYYNASDTANCPAPAPGATATPLPNPIPLDPGYTANGGYNQATGLGVPFGRALIRAIAGV